MSLQQLYEQQLSQVEVDLAKHRKVMTFGFFGLAILAVLVTVIGIIFNDVLGDAQIMLLILYGVLFAVLFLVCLRYSERFKESHCVYKEESLFEIPLWRVAIFTMSKDYLKAFKYMRVITTNRNYEMLRNSKESPSRIRNNWGLADTYAYISLALKLFQLFGQSTQLAVRVGDFKRRSHHLSKGAKDCHHAFPFGYVDSYCVHCIPPEIDLQMANIFYSLHIQFAW